MGELLIFFLIFLSGKREESGFLGDIPLSLLDSIFKILDTCLRTIEN